MAIGTDGGAGVCSGGGEKRKRVDELGDRCEAVDRISALPNELRQHILTHLPLKDAIRTGALARGWRDLWKGRWAYPASVEVQLRSRDALLRELDALAREPRPRRRLDRFSLVVETSKLKSSELRRFTEYAAECRVEDLHIEMRKSSKLNFHLPLSSPLPRASRSAASASPACTTRTPSRSTLSRSSGSTQYPLRWGLTKSWRCAQASSLLTCAAAIVTSRDAGPSCIGT